jgi:hypothetical protein
MVYGLDRPAGTSLSTLDRSDILVDEDLFPANGVGHLLSALDGFLAEDDFLGYPGLLLDVNGLGAQGTSITTSSNAPASAALTGRSTTRRSTRTCSSVTGRSGSAAR